MQSTEWRPVVGFEGHYEVSNIGRVRSLDRYARAGHHPSRLYPGRDLRLVRIDETGRVTVSLHKDGMQRTRLVHHLVLEAFVGPRPEGMEACHWNGDAADNRAANLRWDTHLANEADKSRHGTHHNSIRTHCPRGHELVAPNFVAADLARGHRKCRACNQARAHAQKRRVPLDVNIADAKYRIIMQAAA